MTTPTDKQKAPTSWATNVLVGVPLFMAVFALTGTVGQWIAGIALALLLVGTPGMVGRLLVLSYGVFVAFMVIAGLDLIGRPL